ncbi:VOC family protein [Brevundimonas sp. SL130]|uniref:VOC family protein n=1 Tax=Brevundimonas sp. SL130 TaxID=2995143 RepID=UPI00226D2FCC|nr:VOC family protein [Brevundimonas sp. SL130]WAC59032.1 VOC family protein [Brevundimonas sp. SL130]
MNIVGPDFLVFGVDDVKVCADYLTDFGLKPVDVTEAGGRFEALDGTGIILRHRNDPALPPELGTASLLRQQIYGVVAPEDIEAIAAELSKDRTVVRLDDGSLETVDDHGFALKFQLTIRRPLDLPPERLNAPGSPPQRGPNEIGVWDDMPARPRTLSHVVLFTPDTEAASRFYEERLGFKITDVLVGAGPFLRPHACDDHHTLFLIQAPAHMQGCEHLAFHMGGPTEVLLAGNRFVEAGYESFWGPGRHRFGSNWFWYFNSPLGCHVEYDADMDKHDDDWIARQEPVGAEASQIFLLQYRRKWFPSGGPNKDH